MASLRYGSLLLDDLANLTLVSQPLVEDFLYENKVLMIAADPGIGKSLIATQLAVSLSSAIPLFGALKIPSPRYVYYLQLEGAYEEFIERMRAMQQVIPIATDYLCWDSTPHLNVLKDDHVDAVVARIKDWHRPDCIIIDPLYMSVMGGLSKDEPASAFVRFSSILGKEFGASRILIHHTHRALYDRKGEQIEEVDPFYGSQWLKAHVDISYHLKALDADHAQTRLHNTKARAANVMKNIVLQYHPETMTCTMVGERGSDTATARILAYFNDCKKAGDATDFYQVQRRCQVSTAQLRHLLNQTVISEKITVDKSNGRKHIWRVR